MAKYLKLFKNHAQYETFIGGGGDTPFVKPNVSLCIEENEVHYNPLNWADEYLTFVALEDGKFTFGYNGVSYSLDNGKTWTELPADTESPTVTAGNKIMWKGHFGDALYDAFKTTGKFDVQGNVMSLLYGDDFKGQTDLSGYSHTIFISLFMSTQVVNAKNLSLPATTLGYACYNSMFAGCTSLITAPELPATTLTDSCYFGMFEQCTSLVTAPELPATTLTDSCYGHMFAGCTSLVTAPELPATTLANSCYQDMFSGCTSLTTAPVLPATTLVNGCYNSMFQGCTSLITAPVLPATTLVNGCYNYMFNECYSLKYIKAMFTTSPVGNYTAAWVWNVAETGTFVKNSAATWDVTGDSGIPSGWTVVTE